MGLFEFRPMSVILILLVLSVVSSSEHVTLDKSRPSSTSAHSSSTAPSQHNEQGISQVLETLGVVCKCCDSAGDCTTLSKSWSCHKVQCLPWKLS